MNDTIKEFDQVCCRETGTVLGTVERLEGDLAVVRMIESGEREQFSLAEIARVEKTDRGSASSRENGCRRRMPKTMRIILWIPVVIAVWWGLVCASAALGFDTLAMFLAFPYLLVVSAMGGRIG